MRGRISVLLFVSGVRIAAAIFLIRRQALVGLRRHSHLCGAAVSALYNLVSVMCRDTCRPVTRSTGPDRRDGVNSVAVASFPVLPALLSA